MLAAGRIDARAGRGAGLWLRQRERDLAQLVGRLVGHEDPGRQRPRDADAADAPAAATDLDDARLADAAEHDAAVRPKPHRAQGRSVLLIARDRHKGRRLIATDLGQGSANRARGSG